jgi:hypothetical protein
MPVIRIISGGETGADRGGLEAAIHCSVPHGGYCPKGRKAEDGVIPVGYRLQEIPSAEYPARTTANVVDSHGTVIFTQGALNGDSLQVAGHAGERKKPCLHVDLDSLSRKAAVAIIIKWLKESCPRECVLNITGSRASRAPGIEQAVMVRMVDVLIVVNPGCRKPRPLVEKQ